MKESKLKGRIVLFCEIIVSASFDSFGIDLQLM